MRFWQILFLFVFILGCSENYTPKPRGYFRIEFPEKTYLPIQKIYPYSFELPNYAQIFKDNRNPNRKNWINVTVPENNVEIHISYYDLTQPNKTKLQALIELMEDTRELA